MSPSEQKVQAIVLGVVKYGDHGHVMRTFTPSVGLTPFMVHSLRSKKAGTMRPSMTMPMSVLDIVVNARGKGNLKTISEVHPIEHWRTLHTDPIKMTLCTFASEVVQKVITEEHAEEALFEDLLKWLYALDDEDAKLGTSAHELLLKLSRHLGCFPHIETYKTDYVFDMLDGYFVSDAPNHSHWLTARESTALVDLIHHKKVDKVMRQTLLGELLSYLRIHHEPFGTVKSLEIIRTLLT
ncbi:DNA repair protein RecO [Phaeocystidibacter luteus]|uniref:DNA replication/recombination mediator RecO N-terminal domain-containing protein n=1 Tax=Phaeocystidibacter luteus TaxID=911197 RepID=A0A6N6REU6_9FLAO|nr:recombination protein O N-terminal domain-containing protein [Phaeocystidibacter luteus]KAB2808717.1 hypothetical protein F8C67_10545 [Phaeocystidibacter luteus]